MFLVHGNWRGGRLYPILQFPALGLMQLLKLQFTEKMSRFRWSLTTVQRVYEFAGLEPRIGLLEWTTGVDYWTDL